MLCWIQRESFEVMPARMYLTLPSQSCQAGRDPLSPYAYAAMASRNQCAVSHAFNVHADTCDAYDTPAQLQPAALKSIALLPFVPFLPSPRRRWDIHFDVARKFHVSQLSILLQCPQSLALLTDHQHQNMVMESIHVSCMSNTVQIAVLYITSDQPAAHEQQS